MNLNLNAKQRLEIETVIKKSGFDPGLFEYSSRESRQVFVYVRHAYDALSGDEPTNAEAISVKSRPDCFFTFERNQDGVFLSSMFPEFEVGPDIRSRSGWQGLLRALEDWLSILRHEFDSTRNDAISSRTLEQLLESKDLGQISVEFKRAEANCESDPSAAVTAACAIIEAASKLYISEHGLELPSKLTVMPLWEIVRKHMFQSDNDQIRKDVSKVASGLITTVDGIGSLRSHAGSAHGKGPHERAVEISDARLAVHVSHSLVLYILDKSNSSKRSRKR